MFYSHEILTQRKYGIATIWLVATLGSKSTSKKISKKALLDVNIPKACDTVTKADVPMALRLQSNLLFGISRVYSSQCNYVLMDAESTQHDMRSMLKILRNANLDPNAGNARPEQLIMPDDPAFMPDIIPYLDLDFSALELRTQGSSQRTMVCPGSMISSRTSQDSPGGSLEIVLPSDVSESVGQPIGTAHPGVDPRPSFGYEDEVGFLPDVDFAFDEDGNLVENVAGYVPVTPFGAVPPKAAGGDRSSEVSLIVRMRQEDDEGQAALQTVLETGGHFDDEPLHFDNNSLRSAEIQPEEGTREKDEDAVGEDEMTAAQVRRHRGRRTLPVDDLTQEVRSSDLQSWQTNYLVNMRAAQAQKQHYRLPTLTKNYAASCVWANGLGRLGQQGTIMQQYGPLRRFAGSALREMIFGKQTPVAKRKRGLAETGANEERRVRKRSDEVEARRGDEEAPIPFDEKDIEIGREAPPALDDISSQMPWNIASSAGWGSRGGSIRPASRTGSLAMPGIAALRGVPFGSIAGIPSSAPSTNPFDRRASRRLLSASPLQAYGQPSAAGEIEDVDLVGNLGENDSALDDFQLYGPGAGVDTQTAAEMQWISGALAKEEANFVDFILAKVEESGSKVITFEHLLPPRSNTKIVAAQAFLHMLSLASKGLLGVEQEDGFCAPIHMNVVATL